MKTSAGPRRVRESAAPSPPGRVGRGGGRPAGLFGGGPRALCALGLAFSCWAWASPQNFRDKGVYLIKSEGRDMGREEFEADIRGGEGSVTTKSALTVPKDGAFNALSVETALTFRQGRPASYFLSASSGGEKQGMSIAFAPLSAECEYDTGAGKTRQKVDVPPGAVVMDHNVFAHFALLLARYDMKRPSSQGFSVFVPQLGRDGLGTVFVQYAGPDQVLWGQRRSKADRFRVSSPALTLDVWRDSDGRVLKLTAAQSGAEITRVK